MMDEYYVKKGEWTCMSFHGMKRKGGGEEGERRERRGRDEGEMRER